MLVFHFALALIFSLTFNFSSSFFCFFFSFPSCLALPILYLLHFLSLACSPSFRYDPFPKTLPSLSRSFHLPSSLPFATNPACPLHFTSLSFASLVTAFLSHYLSLSISLPLSFMTARFLPEPVLLFSAIYIV